MKLLVFSHPCITAVNQSFYADLEAETGWTVTLVLPSKWKTEYGMRDGSARWPGLKAKVLPIDVLLPGDIPRHLYRSFFVTLLRREKPDAIYVHHEPYGFATAQIYLANLLTGNCRIGFYAAQNILKNYPPPIRQIERWVLRQSSFAFPVTEGALEILRTKHYTGAAEVLPLAVSSTIYQPSPQWTSERRNELGIPPERVIIGYLGRFVEEKGLGTLLSALELLGDLPWELMLVGNGPFEAEIRERMDRSSVLKDRIRIVGYVPHEEAPHWLSLFDMLVLPSETRAAWKEQFGRVLVEAMACGTPVIGSNSGEIPNIIEHTGGGLVFPEANVSALAECLHRLVSSSQLRDQLAEQGRRSAVRDYDQVHLVRRFSTVIEAAVNGKASV